MKWFELLENIFGIAADRLRAFLVEAAQGTGDAAVVAANLLALWDQEVDPLKLSAVIKELPAELLGLFKGHFNGRHHPDNFVG